MALKTLDVQEPWFSMIARGEKTVEGRTGTAEAYAQVTRVRLREPASGRECVREVAAVGHYAPSACTLEDYLAAEGWERAAPHAGSLEGAVAAYSSVVLPDGSPVFSAERIGARGGIVALRLGALVPD